MFMRSHIAVFCAALAFISCSNSATSGSEGDSSSEQLEASSSLQSSAKKTSSGALSSRVSSTILSSSSSSSQKASSGSNVYWNQSISYGILTDSRDSKKYRTTKIGSQNWMAENLNFIANVGESRCYDVKTTYCSKYGRLYDWEAATASCPDGWHLPDSSEWNQLAKHLGGSSVAGKILKASTSLWKTNTGNDAFGFAALPSGSYDNEQYYDLGNAGLFWTSTEMNSTTGYYQDIIGSSNALRGGSEKMEIGLAVRCIQDSEIGVSSSLGLSSQELPASSIASSSEALASSSVKSSSSGLSNSTMKDSRDGKTYKIVVIGDQTWMAENLAYLPSVNPTTDSSSVTAKYYVYQYSGIDTAAAKNQTMLPSGGTKYLNSYSTYGVLYNWPAVMAGASSSKSYPSNVRGICPTAWHVPSDTEWVELERFVSDSIGSQVGYSLKSKAGWYVNTLNTDRFGFSALPGGYFDGSWFASVGNYGHWWTSTASNTNEAYYRYLGYEWGTVGTDDYPKYNGFSVRCVKD